MLEPAPELPQRKTMRLPGFDYGKGHIYFITLCTHVRARLFGLSTAERIVLFPAGEMVGATWQALPAFIPGLLLDENIVMPDHFHAILALIDPQDGRGPSPAPTLADVVRRFKGQVLREYRKGVDSGLWKPYNEHLWQRGYHEHVIRDDDDLQAHREYIVNNPRRWQMDLEK
jgi:putative transposase